MNRILVISASAEAELAEATAWYNQLRYGLGDDLVLCTEQAFERILEYPEAFPVIFPDVRRSIIRRFPYGVFFRIRHVRIEVEAIFPLRANLAYLKERLGANS
jgi:hypothetical protein